MSNIDDIKQRIDIVDLVSQYVTLKRAGRDFVANCPFHTERTPSFHVSPARQTWHCFGACSTGGDIFGFIMRKDGCDFREALRTLADRAGVALDQRRDPQEDARRSKLFDVNEEAAAFYQSRLRELDAAAVARDYLHARGVSDDSITAFQLGYAPNAWDGLLTHLQSRGHSAQDALAAGLAIEGERGAYDRFRHRLIFPIRDERGRVAGFGGRLLPGEAVGSGGSGAPQPKYVNTSQSPLFDKSAVLYGLDRARDAIRSEGCAVIVEGYMDVIAAHEHGYANVIASMGTALTERQVGILKRYTKNLVLALDADAAGSEATLRGVQTVTNAVDREATPVPNWRGVIRHQETLAADIRVVTMPEGRDPDDVIRADHEGWAELVRTAKPVLDHLFDAAVTRHDLTSPRERSVVASELLPMVASVSDRVVQAHYLQRLARMVQVDEAVLRLDMRQPQRNASRPADAATTAAGARAVSGNAPSSTRDRREEFCLAILFRYPALRSEGLGLDPGIFGQSENRALFDAWIEWADEGEPFGESLGPDLRPHFERVNNLDLPVYTDDASAQALRLTVEGIELQRLRLAKRTSEAAVASLEADASTAARRTQTTGESSGVGDEDIAEDEGAPATAFIEDMQAGLTMHRRLLDKRRSGAPSGEVVNER